MNCKLKEWRRFVRRLIATLRTSYFLIILQTAALGAAALFSEHKLAKLREAELLSCESSVLCSTHLFLEFKSLDLAAAVLLAMNHQKRKYLAQPMHEQRNCADHVICGPPATQSEAYL